MADTFDDTRAALEKQIAELKREVTRMSKSLSARASDALEDADDLYEQGRSRARHAVAQVRDQAQVAVGAMRENPGTTATVISTVALLGLAAGMLLSGALSGDRRR